jgi:carbamate kinase
VTAIAVVAVGGNALAPEGEQPTYELERENARTAAGAIVELWDAGYRIAVTHGNGPQVGRLALQQELAAGLVPRQPLFVLGAMTQGQIGHLLVSALREAIGGRPVEPVAVVTHMTVDPGDPAFSQPSKPIGLFFDAESARQISARYGWEMEDDAGRGYRRRVPSPSPAWLVFSATASASCSSWWRCATSVPRGPGPIFRSHRFSAPRSPCCCFESRPRRHSGSPQRSWRSGCGCILLNAISTRTFTSR